MVIPSKSIRECQGVYFYLSKFRENAFKQLIFKKNRHFFLAVSDSQQNQMKGTEFFVFCFFLNIPCPHTYINYIPHQQGIFFILGIHTLTCHCHLVYFRVHSWCCVFCGFGQIYDNVYHHYSIMQNSFTSSKLHLIHPFSLQPLVTTGLFTVSIVFPFPDSIQLESYSMQPFNTGVVHIVIFL